MSLRKIKDELKSIREEISNPKPRWVEQMKEANRDRLARRLCFVIAAAAAERRGVAHDGDALTPHQRGIARMVKEKLCRNDSGRQLVAELEGMAQ